jgi:hypothetical protein
MAIPQLQFLNLPQIDASIQQQKAAEFQNALAPYMLQKTQMDVEKGGLEMQAYRDKVARDKVIRDELAKQYAARNGQAMQAMPASDSPTSYAAPDNPMSPRVAGPDWMPKQPPQQPQPQQMAMAQELDARAKRAAMLRSQAEIYMKNGDVATANTLEDQAIKLEPKWNTTPHYDQSGNAFILNEQGGSKPLAGIKARDKLISDDLGGTRILRTEYSAEPVSTLAKTMTPGEIASNAVARGNLSVSQQRLAFDQGQPKGQVVQTDQGVVLVDPRGGTAQPVTLNGQPLQPKLKDIPATANASVTTNLQNLTRAETALALVKGENVGAAEGDKSATGWKGYLPNQLLNRVDPSGVDARAAIADLGSMVIHDRSGAAVTASEFPRLAPFVPTEKDDQATIIKKLSRFIDVYKQETNAMADTYSRDQGYKPNPVLERRSGATPAATSRVESNSMPAPSQYVGATVTDKSNGIKYKSDGKNWVRQ